MRNTVLFILLFGAGTSWAVKVGCQNHVRVAHLAPRFHVEVTKNFYPFYPRQFMEWGNWEEHLAAVLRSANPILQKHWRESIYPSEKLDVPPVRFRNRDYDVLSFLGEQRQASVYLVQSGDTEIALKVFHRSFGLFAGWDVDYKLVLKMHMDLSQLGAPIVDVLDADPERRTLALRFAKGYVQKGVRKLYDAGILSADQFLAFNYFSYLHQNDLKARYSSMIDWQISPAWFNPMEENLLYDPWAERWIIIDPM